MPFRRMGRPGLVGMAARTAVVAGTATAVSGSVQRHQQEKAQGQYEQQQYEAQQQQAQMNAAAQQAVAQQQPAAPAAAAGGVDIVAEPDEAFLEVHQSNGGATDPGLLFEQRYAHLVSCQCLEMMQRRAGQYRATREPSTHPHLTRTPNKPTRMKQCSSAARHPTSHLPPHLAGGGTVLTTGLRLRPLVPLVLTRRLAVQQASPIPGPLHRH